MTLSVAVFDLDGVVRNFDPDHPGEVEARHGLASGTLVSTAFSPELIDPLVTGRTTRAQWMAAVGRAVGSAEAAAEWLSRPGVVDREVVAVIDELRERGLRVALCTNGTDTVPGELVELGVRDRFDVLVNSADIGVAKPDHRIYRHLCTTVGAEPGRVFFTDDRPANVEAATALGLAARVFTSAAELRSDLASLLADGTG